MRSATKVILVSTVLSAPMTWVALSAIYLSRPVALAGRVILVPMLVLEWLSSSDPARQPSQAALWIYTIVGQLLWFWAMGLLVWLLTRRLRAVFRRSRIT